MQIRRDSEGLSSSLFLALLDFIQSFPLGPGPKSLEKSRKSLESLEKSRKSLESLELRSGRPPNSIETQKELK